MLAPSGNDTNGTKSTIIHRGVRLGAYTLALTLIGIVGGCPEAAFLRVLSYCPLFVLVFLVCLRVWLVLSSCVCAESLSLLGGPGLVPCSLW